MSVVSLGRSQQTATAGLSAQQTPNGSTNNISNVGINFVGLNSVAVFFTAELHIDRVAWQLWLAGFSIDQAYIKVCQRKAQKTSPSSALPSQAIVKNYILSQYRNFELLEHYLHRPKLLFNQLIFPLDTGTKQYLIDSYYRFEPKVLRELLGKKLSSRAMRKELDDAHVRTQIPLPGCRLGSIVMQYFTINSDNAIDDINIQLAQDARDLKSIIVNHTKVLDEFRARVIDNITQRQEQQKQQQQQQKPTQDHRDEERVINSASGGVGAVNQALFDGAVATTLITTTTYAKVIEKLATSTTFKNLLRNVFTIGAGLSYGKELRDIFSALVEKVVEPCAVCGWGKAEVVVFFNAVVAAFDGVESLQPSYRKRYGPSLSKLFEAVKLAAERLISV
ncbi:hypothetical protein HK100_004510 [Physocladia obscura]|uniref:Uncharacterized protein n=1 Tax=Physocladia obscura TaxID=109957 RepID=A0AAD5SST8_9FUNG|nr:hypothetical protein HK100_004510 [Physocladia obscura]